MNVIGQVNFNWGNYQIGYDLLSQNVAGNYSTVRIYGVINVSNSYVSWSSGTAAAHVATTGLATRYNKGSYTVLANDFNVGHDENGNCSIGIGGYLHTTYTSGDCSGTMTLPQIQRTAVINSFQGNDIEEDFKVTYTKRSNSYAYKLRISIPYVRVLETIDYNTSGAAFRLSDASKDIIYGYAKGQNLEKVPLGVVVETWSSGKVGESGEIVNQCDVGSTAKIHIDGTDKKAMPYVRSNGEWKRVRIYVRNNGNWERSK